jgi:hypothetical protein
MSSPELRELESLKGSTELLCLFKLFSAPILIRNDFIGGLREIL